MGFYEKKNKVCPDCQREMDYYETSCLLCGHEFEVEYNDPRAPYIIDNVGDYLYKFERLERKNTKIGWSWCAFILGPTWMFYRKMYKEGIFFFGVPLLLEWISSFFYLLSDGIVLIVAIINLVLTLSLGICAGLFCDYLYMQKLNELVKQGDMLDEEARLVFAQDKGGTSGKMVLAYFGLCIAASLVLTLAEIAMAGMNL